MNTERNPAEGWTWLLNAKKWHCMRNARSLCGRYMTFTTPSEGYEVGNDNSPDNCRACACMLEKEKAK
jgi:hypothetical protein